METRLQLQGWVFTPNKNEEYLLEHSTRSINFCTVQAHSKGVTHSLSCRAITSFYSEPLTQSHWRHRNTPFQGHLPPPCFSLANTTPVHPYLSG
ncbi:hypothetical protein XELAEV_18002653mg [Xenopus laevis]|nr:hypothetical protein XELAEV_18002653mg [Xenopus laevis]